MLRCLTVIALVMLVVLGVVAYQLYSASPLNPAKPTVVPTIIPVATAQQAASSFDQKIAAYEQAVAAGGKKPVELVLTQVEVASKIQQMLAARGADQLQNLSVQLKSGGALISATTSVQGISMPVEADAQLSAASGMLGVTIASVKAAGVDLPQAVQDQLLQGIQRAVGLNDLQKIDVGIEVQAVQVTPDQVRISGTSR